jgi:GT2 family glycosyltransferase
MLKVSVIILPFRRPQIIKHVFDAIFAQTHKNLEVIAVINDSGDGSREVLQKNYPLVKIIEPGYNSLFAAGNNIGIKNSLGELIQLVNDDLILEPNYIEEMLKAFEDENVAAATGKLLRYDLAKNQKTNIIDTTGVIVFKSGGVRDRGQLQQDLGQFDKDTDIFGVSGAGAMFRKSALEKVKYKEEYFDEDFGMYWEDVDLSWRLKNAGFSIRFVPNAIAYHGRTAGQSEGGYMHPIKFIQHHQKFSSQLKRWNYKNHNLMHLKNAKHILNPAYIVREIGMFGYILIFETSTLKILPELFRQISKIWKKRKAGAH